VRSQGRLAQRRPAGEFVQGHVVQQRGELRGVVRLNRLEVEPLCTPAPVNVGHLLTITTWIRGFQTARVYGLACRSAVTCCFRRAGRHGNDLKTGGQPWYRAPPVCFESGPAPPWFWRSLR